MSKVFQLKPNPGPLRALMEEIGTNEPATVFALREDDLWPLTRCPVCGGREVGSTHYGESYYLHRPSCRNIDWRDFRFETNAGPVAPCVVQP
jgi:hypothetical protein